MMSILWAALIGIATWPELPGGTLQLRLAARVKRKTQKAEVFEIVL